MGHWKLPSGFIFLLLVILSSKLFASDVSKSSPVIKKFGAHVAVVQDKPIKNNHKFKIAFDVGSQNKNGGLNRSFDSLARFINMHVANGTPIKNIDLALVIHGKAAFDALHENAFEERFLESNPNIELLNELMKYNVSVYVCGQTAGFLSIKNDELMEGIVMSLSAMTAHALLQQDGYTLNPF
jgi:intracellular sulfur oxidation DsrE/DsrF family protein